MTVWYSTRYPRDAESNRCKRRVEVIRQAPEGAVGIMSIDMHAVRPCGGRLIDGKCEFCDVTTIEEGAMSKPKLTKLPVDVFEAKAGANIGDTIEQIFAEVQASGRESWVEFNGTALKARPDDTRDAIYTRWADARGR